ncbi:hypothetical protein V5799_010021 [Amblyomma americanum]|uniref:C2H2-type domain-containing protein n=1 Tax=Amblyomma americanum TaxID=6943 RepID=A0AAQ4FAC8_AMBAM
MGADEFNKLRVLLQTFEQEELQLLEDENTEWMPRLRSIPPSRIVKCILRALKSFDKEAHRLQGIAWIRCWLMPLEDQRKWKFCRVAETPTLHGCFEALTRISSDLKWLNDDASEAPHAWIVRGGSVHACLLAEMIVEERERVERYAVYVSLWTTQPLLAVRCGRHFIRRIQEVVQLAFGSVTFLFGEIRGSPEEALKTALSTQSNLSAQARGQRYLIADQKPRECLAVGSHKEKLFTGPDAVAGTEQNASKKRENFPCPECWEDFHSQQELDRHYSHVHLGKMKTQHFCSHCPYWSFTR